MMLITSPINVSMFGEIRVRANPLTIFCSNQPLPLPNALVQVKKLVLWGENPVLAASLITHAAGGVALIFRSVVNGQQLQNLQLSLTVRRDHRRRLAHLLAQQRAADR